MTSDLTPDPPKILRGLSLVSDVSLVKIGAQVLDLLAFVTNGITEGHDDMLDCDSHSQK